MDGLHKLSSNLSTEELQSLPRGIGILCTSNPASAREVKKDKLKLYLEEIKNVTKSAHTHTHVYIEPDFCRKSKKTNNSPYCPFVGLLDPALLSLCGLAPLLLVSLTADPALDARSSSCSPHSLASFADDCSRILFKSAFCRSLSASTYGCAWIAFEGMP